MAEITMMYEGTQVGTAQITQEGLYYLVDCRCSIPSSEVLRAYAEQEEGSAVCLGVLVPEDGTLCLRRRFSRSAFPANPTSITVAGAEGTWRDWSGDVAGVPISRGLSRRVGGVRQVAVPWNPDETEKYLPFLRHCTPMEIQGERGLTLEPGRLEDL